MKNIGILICLLVFCSIIPAQTRVVPLMDAGGLVVLGGVRNGKFVAPAETIKTMKVGDRFTYFGIYTQNVAGKKLTQVDKTGEHCSDTATVEVEDSTEAGVLIGSNADWDAMIRTHEILFNGFGHTWGELKFWNNAVYNKVVTDFLQTRGIAKPVARITQAFRADLDGDNTDEVILVGNKYNPEAADGPKLGDYSFVLVRKTVGGSVKNILVGGAISPKDFPDGSLSLLHVTAINDLNGDGKLEIVVQGYEYEGMSNAVYQFDGTSFTKVLGVYCGL
jgi:hypothetical protein